MPLSVMIPDNITETSATERTGKGSIRVVLNIYAVDQIQRSISGVRTLYVEGQAIDVQSEKLGMDMNYFQVNPENIWTPRVEILNVVESETVYQSAQVYADGSLFLTTRMMSVVTVKFAAQWFPFDRQEFAFEFADGTFRISCTWIPSQNWEPAFGLKNVGELNNLERKLGNTEKNSSDVHGLDSVEVLQQSNFILGVAIVEDARRRVGCTTLRDIKDCVSEF